jgi:hypothetical protein
LSLGMVVLNSKHGLASLPGAGSKRRSGQNVRWNNLPKISTKRNSPDGLQGSDR